MLRKDKMAQFTITIDTGTMPLATAYSLYAKRNVKAPNSKETDEEFTIRTIGKKFQDDLHIESVNEAIKPVADAVVKPPITINGKPVDITPKAEEAVVAEEIITP